MRGGEPLLLGGASPVGRDDESDLAGGELVFRGSVTSGTGFASSRRRPQSRPPHRSRAEIAASITTPGRTLKGTSVSKTRWACTSTSCG